MPNHTSKVRFIILAVARTGSNMLCTLLHSHPDILCHHELYNPADIFYALPLRGTDFSFNGMNMEARDNKPTEFLNQVWQYPEGHSHLGFKMTGRQNEPALEALLDDQEIKKIILRREDKLATYVSRLIAEKRDIWEDYGEQPLKEKNQKVRVDPGAFRESVKANEAHYEYLETRLSDTGQNAFRLTYESLNDENTHKALLSYLGCSYQALTASSRRQNPEPLSDLVENYEEVREIFDF